jgi:ubiquinone/menaquinone biosynthesis C-methylase UbiE
MKYLLVSAILLIAIITTAALFAQQPGIPAPPPPYLRVTSKASLIHLGSLDSFDITEGGTRAASLLYDCLTRKDAQSAREAIEIYRQIIPSENFGGEYTALEWIGEFMAASGAERKTMRADPVTAAWYDYLAQDDFEPLRDYLKKKYHLQEWKNRATPKSEPKFRFLEDFILFNNPRRERWEKTSKILDVLGLKKGDVVADIGSGPGYYTFKFAAMVGDRGRIYAVDTNQQHIEYVATLADRLGVNNVETVMPQPAGTHLPRKADMAFLCSLYHNIYALDTDEDRGTFITSIKNNLQPNGTLVIVDNGLVEDTTLPYHGPHLAKELIISQLWYYGLQLVKSYQFIPQRYILVFKMMPEEPPPALLVRLPGDDCVPLASKSSLIRSSPFATSPGFTLAGRRAARLMHAALERKDRQSIGAALESYRELIPRERFGDEYLAWQWFCEYLGASPDQKHRLLAGRFVRSYVERLAPDDFSILKTYLRYKYYFDAVLDDDDVARAGSDAKKISLRDLELPKSAPVTQYQLNEWGEFIAFNSPYREHWERTSKVIEFLKIRPGTRIADLGCGPGYYTFKFSELTGSDGIVYATDTVQTMLDYVREVAEKNDVRNIQTILARDNDTMLPPDSVDLVYLCSVYHAIYMGSLEYVKDGFIESLKRSLRKGARLVIADNAVLADAKNPYYGPRIAPELIISQLQHYGFRLVDRAQFIPQRYILIFKLTS